KRPSWLRSTSSTTGAAEAATGPAARTVMVGVWLRPARGASTASVHAGVTGWIGTFGIDGGVGVVGVVGGAGLPAGGVGVAVGVPGSAGGSGATATGAVGWAVGSAA